MIKNFKTDTCRTVEIKWFDEKSLNIITIPIFLLQILNFLELNVRSL